MPVLEVRRHTMRAKPGQHLSQSGVSLANYVGSSMGPFSLVVSSEKPRAVETAIAMGFATDHQVSELGLLPENILAALNWPNSLSEISKIVREDDACGQFSRGQANCWRAVLDQLSSGQVGLIVTHGGIIELGAIGLSPNADHSLWGDAIGYCEGFRFTKLGNEISCEVLRVPPQFKLIHN